ncbi:MAG: redoxin domain-containing protein [Candidatus Xenobia bacterium]
MKRRWIFPFLVVLTVGFALPGRGAQWQPTEGRELIGQPAPEFDGLTWLDVPPLTMAALRGKVVLIRFWMCGCKLCTPTMPALQKLADRYGAQGLQVIGIHHPKAGVPSDAASVRATVQQLGVHFPIALDNDWKTLHRYWLQGAERSYTSVTFLVDRRGIIRWLHDGGELHPGPPSKHAWESLIHMIGRLLAEPG